MLPRLLAAITALLFGPALAWGGIPASKNRINFNRDIRPILSDRCFACHGPDGNKRESGLRLDLEKGLFEPLPKHTAKRAFVPGNVAESYAYQRMIATDAQEVMPPLTVPHLKLNQHEKDLIREWIEQGAPWSEHWTFVAPRRPDVPAVTDNSWPRNEIDRFILARLEEEGMQPSREADKSALIRRVTLDLIGLPPTVAEVDAFLADTSETAYEKVVDRLLASPHYGEQMAVAWLDAARYADSHGYQSDPERFMSHWRDWVINAYNQNMPFDQFAIEQLAGDLLPNATESQKIATGFNRNHRMNSEGGIIDEEWRVEGVIDRVETTGTTFLGLTLGCARCHDHKYDPITQKEFYSFSAYFNSINERGEFFSVGLDKGKNADPTMKVFRPEVKQQQAKLNEAMAAAEARVAALHARLPELEAKYKEQGAKSPEPEGLALRFALDGTADAVTGPGATAEQVTPPTVTATQPAGAPATAPTTKTGQKKKTIVPAAATRPTHPITLPAAFEPRDETTFADAKLAKGIKFDGKGTAAVDAGQAVAFDGADTFSFGAWVNLQAGDGCILSKMDDGPNHRGFDLFLIGGKVAPHFVNKWPENAIKVVTAKPVPMNVWTHVMVTYDGSSKASGVKVYFDGVPQETTAEVDNLRRTIKSKQPLLIGKRINSSPLNGSVDDVRFYSRVLAPTEVSRLAVGPDLDVLLAIEPDKRAPEQTAKLASALLSPLPEYAAAVAERDSAKQQLDAIENDPRNTTMIMEELPKPRDTFVLTRGQYDLHGEKVEHGVPAILPPLPADAPSNRLTLAKWIVAPENPLTARVQANRLWEKFFGTGLVKTTENFGVQTEWPSHPELLDWLATELIALWWDQKAFQKMIVMSATYRQAAHVTPELIERDPENRLLARGPRFRLSAEQVRDQALAVSGLLSPKIGGPSVKPYQPEDLWAGNLFGNLVKYVPDSGENLYRRSMYTFIKRTAAPANMMTFDMASREYCVVKRSRTNTPLQALDTMNDPQYVEAARVLAKHMMKDGGADPAARIAYGFKRATARPPTVREAEILIQAFNAQLERYKADHEAAAKLLSVGAKERDDTLDAAEHAAYTMAASVILNLDEMINKP
ncbi:MAG TPA: DUF1553 domain-containing protein [Tepidisphaeraceae bacterium]|nr:DUF1553 domain-containing protein [Tepidisphaeraceae bacterium]